MSDKVSFFELTIEDGGGRLIKFSVRPEPDPLKSLYRIVDGKGKDSHVTTEFKVERNVNYVIIALLLVENGLVYSYEYNEAESAVYFGKLSSLVPVNLPS
ncbi:hypothetical protein [Pseudomonas juntendi]|uniref:Uncharacterized protein n=1 Tax=Pseudomonas juntendi TaxID=2666183 RepID=A0A7W2LYR8_9PSED|nr:hypothetical protein [Pseudomonas juntendi]MBA6132648.1 hypothetical protein [Pseudomonas juntendi]MBA6149346.1 hypothetical protein [Pseudomonas juntendi]